MITNLDQLDPSKWTLFSTEQGIGDQVLFMGALKDAIKDLPKSAIVCEQRMIPIIRRSFPDLPTYSYAFVLNIERQTSMINGIFPIGSLQKHYRQSAASFTGTYDPYLKADQALVNKYRSVIRKSCPDSTIVGIAWTGGYWDRQQRTKSMPFLLLFTLLLHPSMDR